MRIGHGFDAHRFIRGRDLRLGGVLIPHDEGLAAHSDGDVLIHALCDALLGAGAMGDIGRHFPDTDASLEGVDSRQLLRRVGAMVREAGLRVSNVDVTVVAERPRLAGFINPMCDNIAADLGVASNRVGIKATTTEGMGFTGREEGIAVHAVALLEE